MEFFHSSKTAYQSMRFIYSRKWEKMNEISENTIKSIVQYKQV